MIVSSHFYTWHWTSVICVPSHPGCPFDGLVHFNRLIEIFKDCVNEYKNDSCSQCFKSYADLNNLYIELESSGNTCLDSNKEVSTVMNNAGGGLICVLLSPRCRCQKPGKIGRNLNVI